MGWVRIDGFSSAVVSAGSIERGGSVPRIDCQDNSISGLV